MLTPTTVGHTGTRWLSNLGALARFLFHTLASWWSLPRPARRVVNRVFKNQVYFTALQAVPLVLILSSILSYIVISQAVRELGRINATQLIGTLMVVVIVQELGPLLTALTVASRSGTAVAAELATNRAMGEVDALEGMGIDPVHYLVLPRFAAIVVSVFCLIILFDVVALTAGMAAAASNDMTTTRYLDIVRESLGTRDVLLTTVKGVVFGVIVGIVPNYRGLATRGATTEVPIASSQAVVVTIVTIFIVSALFVAAGQ